MENLKKGDKIEFCINGNENIIGIVKLTGPLDGIMPYVVVTTNTRDYLVTKDSFIGLAS